MQILADHLVQNLGAFAKSDEAEEAASNFREAVKKCPLAELEISKVNVNAAVDVSTAGQMMAAILNLKSVFELRVVKKQTNSSHTYNGNKWLRKRFASTTPSSSQSKTRKTCETPSAERSTGVPSHSTPRSVETPPSNAIPLEDKYGTRLEYVYIYNIVDYIYISSLYRLKLYMFKLYIYDIWKYQCL